MVVVRFGSDDIRRACSDLPSMRRRWGEDAARSMSRRLQQLEAMQTMADLAFLPCDYREHEGGVFEIAITDQLGILIAQDQAAGQQGTPMNTLTITGIRDRATMTRTP